MQENAFAVRPMQPKVIIWESWPETTGEFAPTYHLAIGLPPRKFIDIAQGTVIQIRPEFRIGNHCSIICEMPFQIIYVKQVFPPPIELLLKVVEMARTQFSTEFQLKTNRSLSNYVSYDQGAIQETIRESMKTANWV
jgi:uncharacterized radical SAM superfamily protein